MEAARLAQACAQQCISVAEALGADVVREHFDADDDGDLLEAFIERDEPWPPDTFPAEWC